MSEKTMRHEQPGHGRAQRPRRRPRDEREREDERPIRDAAPPAPSAHAWQQVERFATTLPFALDPFQREAGAQLAEGRSVLVAAPTGTGKTVVAQFAIWQAREAGRRALYTAPVKALSNQKFRDLRARHGADEVGLLTGDIVENPAAPILVLTTEIYRNMLLEGCRAARLTTTERADELAGPLSARRAAGAASRNHDGPPEAADVAAMARRARLDEELSDVGCVIFDELHYLSDPQRGPVWEEAIIHSPPHIALVGLSATVSNADELRRWMTHVHGPTALVYHDARAVPLEHYFFFEGRLRLVRNAAGERVERFPDIGGEAKLARQRARARRYTFGGEPESGGASGQPVSATGSAGSTTGSATAADEPREHPAPEPGEILTALRHADLLPCLYFLPGRRAVEAAAASAARHLLVAPADRGRLQREVRAWVATLPPDDQRLDQVQRLGALLPRGLAFHHAGLLPALKVMVETLFARGELRAVFATDTLALGINMPARTVVVGSLSKFDGTQMRLLTPNEYQQLTGRAGRRGLDSFGVAVLPYSPWDAFEPAFAALTAPLLPVSSAFTVRYNTILNLWQPGDIARLRIAVASSLREFQRGARREQGRARQRRPERTERAGMLSRAALAELHAVIAVLRALGYIGQQDELTVRGHLLRAIFHPAGVVLVELMLNGAFDDLGPAEVAEVISWFTYDNSDRALRTLFTLPQRLVEARRAVWQAQRLVQSLELAERLDTSPGIVESYHSVALNWWRGMSLGGLLRRVELAEGDVLVSLNQTIDLAQQLQSAVGQTLDRRALWRPPPQGGRAARALDEQRDRLERLRPALQTAWQGMLRGSVALSRAIPGMAEPLPVPEVAAETVPEAAAETVAEVAPLPMAEDEDPEEVARDRAETPGV